MITANALRRVSRRMGIPLGMTEKDYVISWLLKVIYENAHLKDALIFKGGTALRKVYFPDAWRLSHDLDFTIIGGLDVGSIKDGFDEVFEALIMETDMVLSFRSFHVTEGNIMARTQFMGPLAHRNQIRADITLHEKLISDPEWRDVTTAYPDLPLFRVNAYALNEILVEKIRSIIQRGKSRDYYDVWRLVKEHKFDMMKIREQLIKKCEINNIHYKPNLIFDDERLDSAKGYWKRTLVDLTKELPEFDEAIHELKRKLVL